MDKSHITGIKNGIIIDKEPIDINIVDAGALLFGSKKAYFTSIKYTFIDINKTYSTTGIYQYSLLNIIKAITNGIVKIENSLVCIHIL